MELDRHVLYLTTVLILMSTPGPSQLLMLGNSIKHGFPRSLATATGDLTANALQMLAAGLGLSGLLQIFPDALQIIKWGGVIYLLWLALNMIRKTGRHDENSNHTTRIATIRTLWLQGFVTSAVNPKAIIFFAALFPQFISAEYAFWPQHLVLSVCYLLIDGLFLTAYGVLASWLGRQLSDDKKPRLDKFSACGIILAALLPGSRA